MTNYNVRRFSTKEPHVTEKEVFNSYRIVVSGFTSTHKQSYIYEYAYVNGKGYNRDYVAWSKGKIAPASEKRDKLYTAALFYVGIEGAILENAKDVNLETWGVKELTKRINKLLDEFWKHNAITQVEIMFLGGLEEHFNPIETRVYIKKAPAKLESKKMYHKKFSAKKSPLKRMNGDITGLGKNFKRLI